MADRYWVGGSGTWSSTNTANWSTTSGGSGGASVPTSADNVIFNQAGTYTVTLADALDCLDFTVSAGTVTITGTGVRYIYGAFSLSASTIWSATNGMSFRGSTTATKYITTNGVVINSPLSFLHSLSTWRLNGALTTVGINIIQGTFDVDIYTLTCTSYSPNFQMSGGTAYLRAAYTTLQGSNAVSITGGTLYEGTATVICSSTASNVSFSAPGKTFYSVNFTGTSPGTSVTLGASSIFRSLNITPPSTSGVKTVILTSSLTLTFTISGSGGNALRRIAYVSSVPGTTRTMVMPGARTISYADFRDIAASGYTINASTSGGDCGGNSNITFPAARTVYRVGTNTTWAGSSSWATISGDVGNNANFPLAQDTAVIDNNTALTGTLALSSTYNMGTLNASSRTSAITLNHNSAQNLYGSYILGSGVTITGTSQMTLLSTGTQTITCANKTISFPISINKILGSVEFVDAFSSSSSLSLLQGTLDAKNYSVTCGSFSSSNTGIRTLTMGSGLWTLSGTGTVWDITTNTNLTFNKDTADILLSNTTTTARTFAGGGLSYNKLTIGGSTGTSTLTISGSNYFTELASSKTVAHTILLAADQALIGTWSVSGSAGNVVTLDSTVTGTRRYITLANSTSGIDYLNVQDIGNDGVGSFYVGTNSINSGNNLNVLFTGSVVLSTGNFFALFS